MTDHFLYNRNIPIKLGYFKELHIEDGLIHKEDGPALVLIDGTEYWFKNDVLHREDGPAIVNPLGNEEFWYKNNKLHREDGPAIVDEYEEEYIENGIWIKTRIRATGEWYYPTPPTPKKETWLSKLLSFKF